MMEMTVPAVISELERVTEFVNSQLREAGCPMAAQTQVDIAIEEIFVNIASYAYHPEPGEATLRCSVSEEPLQVCIQFLDHGKPYNPLIQADPDITLSAEEREIGGLGIFMVKQCMDDVIYEYVDGKNILTIKKVIE